MSTSQMAGQTRGIGGRLLGLLVFILLIPVFALILITWALLMIIAIIVDVIMLLVSGTEFAVRRVMAIPGWLAGNVLWLLGGRGEWRWLP